MSSTADRSRRWFTGAWALALLSGAVVRGAGAQELDRTQSTSLGTLSTVAQPSIPAAPAAEPAREGEPVRLTNDSLDPDPIQRPPVAPLPLPGASMPPLPVAAGGAAAIPSIPVGPLAEPGMPPVTAPSLPAIPDLSSVERALMDTSVDVARLTERSQQLDAEAAGLGPRKEGLAARARTELRLAYHLSNEQAIALRGGPTVLLQHMARREHVRRVLESTLADLRTVTARSGTIAADRASVAADLAAANARRVALEAQRRDLEVLAGARLPGVAAPLAGGLFGTPAAVPMVPAEPTRTIYGGGASHAVTDVASFGDAQGRLLFPIQGRVEVRRVQRPGSTGPGIEALAPVGTPVRSVFAGRVAYAERYGAFGKVVILDHGERYYTLYANLGAMSVRVGDDLPAGSVVGTTGDDGRGPMLYFEVRQGQSTVDPSPWLGLGL